MRDLASKNNVGDDRGRQTPDVSLWSVHTCAHMHACVAD